MPRKRRYKRAKRTKKLPKLDLSIELKPKVRRKLSKSAGFLRIALAAVILFLMAKFAWHFFFATSAEKKASSPSKIQTVTQTVQKKDPPKVLVEKAAGPAPALKPPPAVPAPKVKNQPSAVAPRLSEAPAQEAKIVYEKVARKAKALTPGKPKILLVIDDIGNTKQYSEILESLEDSVTYAILPNLHYSEYFGHLSELTGAEVILHQPLEAQSGTIPGPGLITRSMEPSHMKTVLKYNLDSVVHAIGMNNHMGSEGTQDRTVMRTVLRELKKRNMFFLDSYTTSKSVAGAIAKELEVPFLQRGVFLDNADDPAAIRKQLEELAKEARRDGYAIGIGHYRYNTLSVLKEEIPYLRQAGFELAGLYDFIQDRR